MGWSISCVRNERHELSPIIRAHRRLLLPLRSVEKMVTKEGEPERRSVASAGWWMPVTYQNVKMSMKK